MAAGEKNRRASRSFGKLLLSLVLLASMLLCGSARAQVQRVWSAVYDGPNVEPFQPDYDIANAVAADAAGHVYVAGSAANAAGRDDLTLIKYDPNGQILWLARYSGNAGGGVSAAALALDDAGHIYVAGSDSELATGVDIVTLKYDADGQLLWVARYNGPGNTSDAASALCLDAAGNAYLTGYSYNESEDFDVVTLKYDAQGNQLWAARYGGILGGEDRGQDLAVDTHGNVYVTGFSVGRCYLNQDSDEVCLYDGLTLKYDSGGNALWVDRYNGRADLYDLFNAIALDPAGRPVVTGASTARDYATEFVTIKFDADGHRLWTARLPDPTGALNGGFDVAVDGAGNAFVVGSSFLALKYNPHGRLLWQAGGGGLGRSVAVDNAGNAYATGWLFSGQAYDSVVVKYDSCGNRLWAGRYETNSGYPNVIHGLALDEVGNVYVTGETRPNPQTGGDFLTVKFAQTEGPLPPVVNIRATVPVTSERPRRPNNPAIFTVLREGGTEKELTVHYAVSGTARNGVDYAALSGSVTIAAGKTSAIILVRPIKDREREGVESVRLDLIPDPPYRLCNRRRALVYIRDDFPWKRPAIGK